MNNSELQAAIEAAADPALQESWDNTGWNINLHNTGIRAVMVCLDCTEEVVTQAREMGCGVIVSHHPLLFHGIREIDTARMPGRVIAPLLESGISLYCAHTSADSAAGGINTWLGGALGLTDCRPLRPQTQKAYKIAVTVPEPYAQDVRDAMTEAGAGALGLYDSCTFSVSGTGTFRPLPGARPALGVPGELMQTGEVRIEALAAGSAVSRVTEAVRSRHPYEMPAVDCWELQDVTSGRAGLGLAGNLPSPERLRDFLDRVRSALECGTLHVSGDLGKTVSRIGLCGGAGHDLIPDAEKAGCDVFLTGELRHNDYYDHGIALVEAGHYDTEKCFVRIMTEALRMSEPVIQYKVAVYGFTGRERPYTDY